MFFSGYKSSITNYDRQVSPSAEVEPLLVWQLQSHHWDWIHRVSQCTSTLYSVVFRISPNLIACSLSSRPNTIWRTNLFSKLPGMLFTNDRRLTLVLNPRLLSQVIFVLSHYQQSMTYLWLCQNNIFSFYYSIWIKLIIFNIFKSTCMPCNHLSLKTYKHGKIILRSVFFQIFFLNFFAEVMFIYTLCYTYNILQVSTQMKV